MEFLKISNVDISHLIKKIKPTHEAIWDEKTGRTITAKMVGDIKDRKWKLECTTVGLSQAECAQITNLLESAPFIEIGFIPPDSANDTIKTITCYGGAISYELYSYAINNIRYSSVGFNLVEQ